MNGTYEAWIEQEKQWANEMKLQHIRSMKKTLILTPPICILVLGIIGILVGDVKQMLFNAIVGLAFGVVVDLLCLLIMLPTNPGKRYIKTLRKTVEKQITDDTRRGEFAAQMLGMGGEGTVKTVVWTNSSKQKEKMVITKDYALRVTPINCTLVFLNQVEMIELDAEEHTVVTHSSNVRVHTRYVQYPMYFYYKTGRAPESGKKRQYDAWLNFESKELRAQILERIQELTEE